MKTLQGTEKQIAYAESLRKEFVAKWSERNEKFESRGIENLNEKQIARWEENKQYIEVICNCEDAARVITATKEDFYGPFESWKNFVLTGKIS